jgi:copper/silver efflux system protein
MIPRIVELCARNRLLVLLAVAFAAVGAMWAIRGVKLDAIPDLSDPQVIIYSEWMGRSPTLVEDQVTYPIVSSLVAAPRVVDVRGYSMFGMSFIYVIFEEGTDLYWARSRVLEYLSSARTRLPEGVSPVLGPDASSIGWVFQYALEDRSGRHGLDELRTLQDFTLRYALGSVSGVAEVASVGGYQKQYQVTVDPERLRAHGATLQEVIAAIRDSNADVGGRIVELTGREYYVRGRGYIQDLGAIERIALRAGSAPGGAPLLVRDVAKVRFGPDIRRGLLDWNGDGEAVGGIVVMRHGENALQVIERVKRKIEELRPSLPAGVELKVAYDRSTLIGRSIDTLRGALLEEMIIVSVVILLFLLHVRSSLLPILSLPLAVALSFLPMVLLDIPSTIMSLGGIAIAIGATVDAEIVMIEAAHKKLEHAGPTADRRRLLAEAAREVTPAIFFSLLVIAVAFLPVFTLPGQAGRLFRPLAYTKTFVMLAAALLSITFAPALRDLLLRGRIFPEDRHPLSRLIVRLYRPFVYVALRRPKSTIAIGVLAVLSAVPLALRLGHEFMPPLNEGDVLYMPMTFPNLSIEEAKRQLQRMDRVLRDFPEVESVFGKVGRAETATDPAPLVMVETTVRLRPQATWRKARRPRWYSRRAPEWLARGLRRLWPEEQSLSWDELVARMSDAMQFPGWSAAWTMPIKARVDMLSTGIRTPIGVKVFGADLQAIERVGVTLERLLTPLAATRSVLYERSLGGLYLDIVPRREALARFGLRVGDVQRLIETAIGGQPIGVTVEGRGRFTINVRYPQEVRSDLDRLRRILVPLPERGAASGGSGMQGALVRRAPVLLAQAMPEMGGSSPAAGAARSRLPEQGPTADVPVFGALPPLPAMGAPDPMAPDASGGGRAPRGRSHIPLGQIADIRIAGGPPMVRDEDGLLVGYVYVDIDQQRRDVGGYVREAKAVVARALASGELRLPAGTFLKWTGQYELLEQLTARMKVIVPLTLMIIIVLLLVHFRSLAEVLIVLLSIPFALVGSVWLLWLLDYRLSTAVWVGIIALVGLAAQTGIVMIVYIDQAYERRRRAGLVRDLRDIVWAHLEGTVLRVRPKLMTVATMLAGLLPLLWASGSGADVMKRIAAPMVGGLLTSAFLTLEIIPVIYTYWRQEQLLWERLAAVDAAALRRLRRATTLLGAGWLLLIAAPISALYVAWPALLLRVTIGLAAAGIVAGTIAYFVHRPSARAIVWPESSRTA